MYYDPNNLLYSAQGTPIAEDMFLSKAYRDNPDKWQDLLGQWNGLAYDPNNVNILKNILKQPGDSKYDDTSAQLQGDEYNKYVEQQNQQSKEAADKYSRPAFEGGQNGGGGPQFQSVGEFAKYLGWNLPDTNTTPTLGSTPTLTSTMPNPTPPTPRPSTIITPANTPPPTAGQPAQSVQSKPVDLPNQNQSTQQPSQTYQPRPQLQNTMRPQGFLNSYQGVK